MPVTTLSAPAPDVVPAPAAHPGADRMTADFLRAVRVAVFGSTLLPLITTLCSAWLLPSPEHQVRMRELLLHFLMIAVVNVAVTLALAPGTARVAPRSRAHAAFLRALPIPTLDPPLAAPA